ncbi:3-dehydroquinate synthase [Heyndrickxia sp. NPDC080065]|uniref:3-dehydroquinate synthase n=1 Tax=Heyndrickxia sp. NPDC080065 TaxID=3390568 RepID=UPI003D025B7C
MTNIEPIQKDFKMNTINISTKSKNYNVYLGENILSKVEGLTNYSKLLIITNEDLKELHLDTLKKHLPNIETHIYIAPNGESAKTSEVYNDCISFGINKGIDRKSMILAFGGGSIGDLAGFVAATYMRGLPFIQIPTTILAHDSAVGGKVAINHPLGKNMVGAFYQPEQVIFDTQFLSTLSDREIRSGFAEVVKHLLIADPHFLQKIMNEIRSLDDLTNNQLQSFLKRGIEIKANIVSMDETENDIRAHLNFGHTLGHALEAHLGYGNLPHGEAVMIGMIYALHLSKHIHHLEMPYEKFIHWIESLGYQWRIPKNIHFDSIFERMKKDKKSSGHTPVFILLKELGKPVIQKIDQQLLRESFYLLQES